MFPWEADIMALIMPDLTMGRLTMVLPTRHTTAHTATTAPISAHAFTHLHLTTDLARFSSATKAKQQPADTISVGGFFMPAMRSY